jgi:EAL domain-containing protein (putative c-di-GMP-specific phosphodiesterase class I)
MQNNQMREHSGLQRNTVFATDLYGMEQGQTPDRHAKDDLAQRVSQGLRAGEFHLMFQGVYDVGTGLLSRAEAQVHWTHPEYGLLLPGVFMAKLAHSDVSYEMGLFIVQTVCRELEIGLARGLQSCPIVIGVPPAVAVNERFASDLIDIARTHGIPPNLLEIELTDSEDAARLLSVRALTADLRDVGVGISYGDFGAGAFALASLGTLEADTVKLSRTLFATVPANERSCTVMAGVLAILASLDVRVIVAGVETAAQARWIAQWPEVLVQGPYVSKPVRSVAELAHRQR